MAWGVVLSPAFLVFVSMSFLGMCFVLLSSGLIGMWVGMELGFFGFLPVLNGKTVGENEASVKYFIVQAVGSAVMMISFIFFSVGSLSWVVSDLFNYMFEPVMVLGFLIKLGVFPMHFWFPSVMGGSSWFSCFWLSVVQKIGPLWGVSGLGLNGLLGDIFLVFLVSTSLVGALGGLAQVQFRPLLAYSSLGQTGWMGLIVLLNLELFFFYIFLYSVLLCGLLFGLNIQGSYSVDDMSGWSPSAGLFFWLFSGMFFLSIAGLPPLAGSALKLMGVMVIVGSYPLFLSVLILSSMISLYYYLSVFINSVVCVSSGSYGMYNDLDLGFMSFALICSVSVVNSLGGLPLFMICGMSVF